jgi:hypothetical protein
MYLLITPQEWVWFASCVASFCFGGGLGFMQARKMYKKDEVAPVYPLKNMHKNFSAIEDKINACKTEYDIEDARLSLFAFAELYTDSGSFVRELQEMLDGKEIEIVGAYSIV